MRKCPKFGGEGGIPWDDGVELYIPQVMNIKEIVIRFGESVDSIQVNYELLWGGVLEGDTHGGSGESLTIIDLEPGEKIVEVYTTFTTIINQISVTLEKPDGSRVEYGPYGSAAGGDSVYITGDIIGFYGIAGEMPLGCMYWNVINYEGTLVNNGISGVS